MHSFDLLVMLCGATGALMVIGSLLLLYKGVIQLETKVGGTSIEADFKNQLRVNIRNPALGLFGIGFAFFALALFESHPRNLGPGDLFELEGKIHLVGDDTVGNVVSARIYSGDWPVPLPSTGEFIVSVRPIEHLFLEVRAPGYQPSLWTVPINPEGAKEGHVVLTLPALKPAAGTPLIEHIKSSNGLSQFPTADSGERLKP
jgi:hypothetical protein